jgi:hypothetical protein
VSRVLPGAAHNPPGRSRSASRLISRITSSQSNVRFSLRHGRTLFCGRVRPHYLGRASREIRHRVAGNGGEECRDRVSETALR